MTDDLEIETAQAETAPEVVPEVPPEPEAPPEVVTKPETEETETDDEGEEKPHKKTGSQRWKEKAAREAQEKEYWKSQALQASKTEAPAPIQVSPDGPKLEDYDTHAEWVKASIRFEAKAMIEAEKRQQTWEQKASKAREKFEDFDEALETAPAPSRAVAEVLNESPIGGEVAYHLATHPDEYQRINRMAPVAAALELGRIEARLAPPAQKKAPAPVTKAPRPPSPVTAVSTPRPSDDGRIESY
jgi:hypothetical protein